MDHEDVIEHLQYISTSIKSLKGHLNNDDVIECAFSMGYLFNGIQDYIEKVKNDHDKKIFPAAKQALEKVKTYENTNSCAYNQYD